MNKRTENFIKSLTPPIALDYYRYFRSRVRFVGDYTSWAEACQASGGYDADEILSNVKESLLKVKNGEAIYERDSVLFDKANYWWPLLAGLLWVASRNDNRLNLLDFGGSLGTVYYQYIRLIRHVTALQWNIVEQKKFVESGKLFFENEHLKFYYDIDECINERHPDAILFSGVIQYLEKPYDLLAEAVDKGFSQILFDRTPFLLSQDDDCITVQKAPHHHYEVSYPAWFFNLDKFLHFFSKDYELIADFDSFDRFNQMNIAAQSKGFIFQKKER